MMTPNIFGGFLLTFTLDDDNLPLESRESFFQQSLIYHPEKKKWIAVSSTVWSGPPSMTSKIPLRGSYPSLMDLFHVHLSIPIVGPETLVEELQLLSKKWKGRSLPNAVRDKISDILGDIADELGDKPPNFRPNWLRALSSGAIFPVESLRDSSLCTSRDSFYIPDKNGVFQNMFSRDVPLLYLSKSTPIHRIQPLLESDVFRPHLKFLEQSVKHSCLIREPRLLNTSASEHYATRSHYVER